MWAPRTQAVREGEQPFVWSIPSVWQCTWFCYFEAAFHGMSFPCYWDRETKTGSYANAKDWIENYRDPWIPITDPNYKPVAGDILVYDGDYGHVIFCETDTMTTEYRNGDPNSFRVGKVGDFNGTLLGVLHYPLVPVETVDRNTDVDQIQTTDDTLRIRTAPSLEAEIVGHVQLGYYNVLDTKEADGYKWYKLAKDRWCADITTKFLPKDDNDFVRQLERFLNETKAKIKALEGENDELRADMSSISKITERWK